MKRCKIRVWDIATQQLLYPDQFSSFNGTRPQSKYRTFITWDGDIYVEGEHVADFVKWKCMNDGIVITQYTGLTDADGREIFEGDIVKELNFGDVWEIVWDEKKACFSINLIDDREVCVPIANRDCQFKILGNRFQGFHP